MEEQFVDFLKKHGAYDKYFRNSKHPIRELESRDYLVSAFTWEETPEGHEYWSYLDDLWKAKSKSKSFYVFPQYAKTSFLSHYLHRGDKIYLSEVLNDSTLPKLAVVDELIHGNGYVEVYLR